MSKSTSRRRRYPGEAEAGFLLLRLNNGSESEKAAIRDIALTLKALGDGSQITRRELLAGSDEQIAQMGRVESLNRILRAYVAIPSIGLASSGKGAKLKVRWRRMGVRSPGRRQAILIEELDAVLIALQLAEDGLIQKIRQCDTCTAWHFRKFSHHRWCNDDCKAAYYRTEPEKRKHAEAEKKNKPHRIKSRKIKGRKPAARG